VKRGKIGTKKGKSIPLVFSFYNQLATPFITGNFKLYKSFAVNSIILLLPGVISSVLLFFLSANKIVHNAEIVVFVLNLLQLQMLGITIVKYGIDQVILSKLQPGSSIVVKQLFFRRVLPLVLIFASVIGFLKGWNYAVYFACSLPLEVFSIIVTVELNVTGKYRSASFLTLMGYPLVLGTISGLALFSLPQANTLFIVFLFSSFLRFALSRYLRNSKARQDIAILSYHIPLQQVGNFLMFRSDQLLIAAGLCLTIFAPMYSISKYLFLAKFPEVICGVVAGLGPIIYKKFADNTRFSIFSLLSNKLFILFSLALFIVQILSIILFPQIIPFSQFLLCLPFLLATLLILPSNLVTYVLLKTNKLSEISRLNFVGAIAGISVFIVAFLFHSAITLSLIVPVQLACYTFLVKPKAGKT
jgi:hypothetical protein